MNSPAEVLGGLSFGGLSLYFLWLLISAIYRRFTNNSLLNHIDKTERVLITNQMDRVKHLEALIAEKDKQLFEMATERGQLLGKIIALEAQLNMMQEAIQSLKKEVSNDAKR